MLMPIDAEKAFDKALEEMCGVEMPLNVRREELRKRVVEIYNQLSSVNVT